MTNSTKLVAVLGATGLQGGSVVQSLLGNSAFQVRCVTRDASSPRAKALVSHGAQVVQADTTQQSQLEKSFSGCWGLFVNYTVIGTDLEEAENLGRAIFLAAAAANIKHVVFSCEPHCDRLTNGRATVDYLDVKARVYEWVYRTQTFNSVTPILPGWFMENFSDPIMQGLLGGFPEKTDNDGYLICRAPFWGGEEQVPWVNIADDFGDLVHGILLDPTRWNHRPVQVVGDPMSFGEMVRIFTLVTGKKARYSPCNPSEVRIGVQYDNLKNSEQGAMFTYTQARDGEYFGYGPTENRTASQLKKAAFKAKGGKGRETLWTLREYFEREYV